MSVVRMCLAMVMIGFTAPMEARAQQAAPVADRAATNQRDFDFVVDKVTANYAGWDTKVTPATRAALSALTARLRDRAANASEAELATLLEEWIDFFKDRHTRIYRQAQQNAPSGPASAAVTYPSLPLTEAQARARLAALGNSRDPIEGIWRIGGDRYRVAILRDGSRPRAFLAVILTTTADGWQAGQIKAEVTRDPGGTLQMTYRTGDHAEVKVAAEIVAEGAAIIVTGYGIWGREVPATADPDIVARQYPSDTLSFKRVSPTTL